MSRIAVIAMENQIEVEYVQELIRRRNLIPEEPLLHIENWPWPVRIYTLGAFRLLVDNMPVPFNGKVQKRPLEMLKALVALGGSGIREDQLTDALWPEAEGDAAGASYRTTLHRLRQLIGHENAVTVKDGRVSIDQRYCWVDAWAFEKAVQSAESGGRNEKSARGETGGGKGKSEIQLLDTAISLYRGHFLAGEDQSWTASPRERTKNRFLRAVDRIGSCWMVVGQPKNAIECYEKGLEVDDLAEEFYRGLITCNLKLGRKAEAIKVYNRCKEVLTAGLGVGPSEETEGIYKKILMKTR
jgi:two-component SAPR family response regulator